MGQIRQGGLKTRLVRTATSKQNCRRDSDEIKSPQTNPLKAFDLSTHRLRGKEVLKIRKCSTKSQTPDCVLQ